jgi:hypothetical protein
MVQSFLGKKPIVIGNSVSADKIDYHINVGNVFMCTHVGDKQIYLGHEKESVVVGASSNEYHSAAAHSLYVHGSVRADGVASGRIDKYGVATDFLQPYFVVKDDCVEDADVVSYTSTTSNALVYGIVRESRARSDGLYDVLVAAKGKTKAWCMSPVVQGELLVSHEHGLVMDGETTRRCTASRLQSRWRRGVLRVHQRRPRASQPATSTRM